MSPDELKDLLLLIAALLPIVVGVVLWLFFSLVEETEKREGADKQDEPLEEEESGDEYEDEGVEFGEAPSVDAEKI